MKILQCIKILAIILSFLCTSALLTGCSKSQEQLYEEAKVIADAKLKEEERLASLIPNKDDYILSCAEINHAGQTNYLGYALIKGHARYGGGNQSGPGLDFANSKSAPYKQDLNEITWTDTFGSDKQFNIEGKFILYTVGFAKRIHKIPCSIVRQGNL